MIKNNNIWKIAVASVILLALWTLICINTSMFTLEEKFLTYDYIMCYIMSIGAWGLAALKFQFPKKFLNTLSVISFLLTPFACMHISMIFFPEIDYALGIYMVNALIYFGFLCIFFALTQKTNTASVITIICAYIFNIASHLVGIFRGTPLIPSDLLAIGTALGVAEQYEFKVDLQIIRATVSAVFFVVLTCKFPLKLNFRFKRIVYPATGIVLAAIVFCSLGSYDISKLDLDLFDQEKNNKIYGMTYGFYINHRRMDLNKPENYNSEEMKAILESVPKSHGGDTPNILVIMNESFSDLGVIGKFQTSKSYMPYINSMKKDTVKGKLIVSPFGGQTCNSEFEFLTGATMGLLPQGSAPYLQYVTSPLPYCVPSHLSDLGYKTIAFHPYYARGWNREKVYGLMGFDEFISIENMDKYLNPDSAKYMRGYLSDQSSYKAVQKMFESKKSNEKLFLFNITMQNHGGYAIGDWNGDVKLKGMTSYPGVNQYLSLVKESDTAFKNLISYFSSYDEKTVILMFGDHLPAVEEEFYEEVKKKPLSQWTSEEMVSRYTVPFVIWANYDIEEKSDVLTSTNYLQNLVYDIAGIPKNGLNVFLDEQKSKFPAINAIGHYDNDMNWILNEENNEELAQYEALEYYMLTGK